MPQFVWRYGICKGITWHFERRRRCRYQAKAKPLKPENFFHTLRVRPYCKNINYCLCKLKKKELEIGYANWEEVFFFFFFSLDKSKPATIKNRSTVGQWVFVEYNNIYYWLGWQCLVTHRALLRLYCTLENPYTCIRLNENDDSQLATKTWDIIEVYVLTTIANDESFLVVLRMPNIPIVSSKPRRDVTITNFIFVVSIIEWVFFFFLLGFVLSKNLQIFNFSYCFGFKEKTKLINTRHVLKLNSQSWY